MERSETLGHDITINTSIRFQFDIATGTSIRTSGGRKREWRVQPTALPLARANPIAKARVIAVKSRATDA
jgi:hypothetical protein